MRISERNSCIPLKIARLQPEIIGNGLDGFLKIALFHVQDAYERKAFCNLFQKRIFGQLHFQPLGVSRADLLADITAKDRLPHLISDLMRNAVRYAKADFFLGHGCVKIDAAARIEPKRRIDSMGGAGINAGRAPRRTLACLRVRRIIFQNAIDNNVYKIDK
ncbi:hypothetical protein SDC9_204637 [bioreactor metagenome]|uniref:Uncharacterized protein n=1 Tax=bioreactor metagenome TaxID=1076179 RepID=A0A645J8Y7_9ZZZZ